MNKGRVVVLDAGYDSYTQEQTIFSDAGYQFEIFDGPAANRRAKIRFGRDAIGVMIRGTVADHSFFSSLPGLKALVRYGVGYDNVDLEAATLHGVRVANVQGYADDSVSDHALALMFACNRALPWANSGDAFGAPPQTPILDFKDCTLGIVGLGHIGTRLAQKANFLFERIVGCDPYVEDCRFFRLGLCRTELSELLAVSHVISLHCNLTQETMGLIGRGAFSQMGQIPILINTARGPVVDEKELLLALAKGQVRSAGVDVFCREPLAGVSLKLAHHPRVLATQHYAWYSEGAKKILQRKAAENMISLLTGRIPDDCLNP